MKHKWLYISIGVIAITATGIFVYAKMTGPPKVTVQQYDWTNGTGTVIIDGTAYPISSNTGIQSKNGYSVEVFKSYVTAINGQGDSAIVLMKNGAITDYILNR